MNFHTKVAAITRGVHTKKQQAQKLAEDTQRAKNKTFVEAEAPKQLKLIKKRILVAAERGEDSIDLFPTGLLGDTILELLGPGFRADTDTTRMVGVSDGQGWSDGSYIPYTRLIWTSEVTKKKSK